MTAPAVSVIIPCHDSAPWAGETVHSVLAQTFTDWELVIVADACSDDSVDVVRAALAGDRRGRVLTCDARHGCAARNLGFAATTGRYVQFLDADDLLHPEKLARQVASLDAGPTDRVALGEHVYFFDGEDPTAGGGERFGPHMTCDDPVTFLLRLWTPRTREGMVPPMSYLTPRAVAAAAGPWDETVALDQDGDYFSRVLLTSRGTTYVPGSISYYRKFRNRVSVSRRSGLRALRSLYRVTRRQERLLEAAIAAGGGRGWEHGYPAAEAAAIFGRRYRATARRAYPVHPRLVRAATERADRLSAPVGPYYDHSTIGRWIERAFGWKVARRLELARRRSARTTA